MKQNSKCISSEWVYAFGAVVLAVLFGVLFGFGFVPLVTPVVYALIAVGLVGAVLYIVSAGNTAYKSICRFSTGRIWIAGFSGTIAAALALLSFSAIAPVWLNSVLIGFLTLFTSLLLIGITRYAACISETSAAT